MAEARSRPLSSLPPTAPSVLSSGAWVSAALDSLLASSTRASSGVMPAGGLLTLSDGRGDSMLVPARGSASPAVLTATGGGS